MHRNIYMKDLEFLLLVLKAPNIMHTNIYMKDLEFLLVVLKLSLPDCVYSH